MRSPRSWIRRSSRLLLAVAVAQALLAPLVASPPPPLNDPQVLTLFKKEIHFFRERSLEHLGSVEIPRGWAQSWWLDAGAGRLAVLSKEGLLGQKGPLQLTIVDLAARKLVTSEAVAGTSQVLIHSPSGQVGFLSVLTNEGKKSTAPPSRVVRIDLSTPAARAVTATRDLAAPPSAMGLSNDEKTLVLVFAGASGKGRADRKPGRVELYASDSLEPRGSIDLPGPADGVFWNGDRSRLYLEDVGLDDPRPEVALPGRLYVVDPASGGMTADLELGVGPGPLGWDAERSVFYLLTRPRKAKGAAASLQVVRGEAVESEIGLPSRPVAVLPSADRGRFFVLEEKGITIVDGGLTSILGRIPLPDTPTGLLPIDASNRAFVSFGGSSQVASIDLGTRQLLAKITTGRTGKKIGLFAAAVLGTALSQANSMMLTGNQYAMAQVVTYPSPETSGLLSPDAKLAFFYNSQTGDYTVVDVESNRVVDQIAGGGLRFLDDGKRAVVMQVTDVVLWDLEQRKTLVEIDAGGGGKSVCPDGDHVWVIAGIHSLNVVDIGKRAVVKKFDKLGGAVVFYDAAPSAATASAP